MAAMNEFLADYEQGRREHRHLDAELRALRFPPDTFYVALCSDCTAGTTAARSTCI